MSYHTTAATAEAPSIICDVSADPVSISCRALWAAVLMNGIRESTGWFVRCGFGDFGDPDATNWIGSPDFREVCSLAGLDPDYVERGLRRSEAAA